MANQEFEAQLATASQRLVTQSPFFSTEFNTAIIHGPLRIYFADRHETEALQLYFRLQEVLKEEGLELNQLFNDSDNLFVMLYSDLNVTPEAMKPIGDKETIWYTKRFDEHEVIGVDMQRLYTEGASSRENLCQKIKMRFCANA